MWVETVPGEQAGNRLAEKTEKRCGQSKKGKQGIPKSEAVGEARAGRREEEGRLYMIPERREWLENGSKGVDCKVSQMTGHQMDLL